MKAAINISQRPPVIDQAMKAPEHLGRDYVKGLSHELRTPLNVIIGLCQLLERDLKRPLPDVHRDAVKRMERNARVLLHSINQLLEHLRNEYVD